MPFGGALPRGKLRKILNVVECDGITEDRELGTAVLTRFSFHKNGPKAKCIVTPTSMPVNKKQ